MANRTIHARFRFAVNAFRIGLALALFLPMLTACGKRPSQVDPPPGMAKEIYKREYPDIQTDPKP